MPTLLVDRPSQLLGKADISNAGLIMWTIIVSGLLFQVGHFFEHAFQWVVWLLGNYSEICGR